MAEKRGLFVVFEGIDGSGTSTHEYRLVERIEEWNKYQDVMRTHEPWKSGEIKRKLKEDQDAYSNPFEMADLFVSDRADHTRRLIRPNLDAGAIVLCSRFKMSTCAYQWAQGADLQKLLEMHENRGILTPDVTYFIDVPQEVAAARIMERKERIGQEMEKFEKNQEFVKKLVSAYDSLVSMAQVDDRIFGRVVKVDGNRKVEDVARDIHVDFKEIYDGWMKK